MRLQFVWKVFVLYFLFFYFSFWIFRFVCRHVWTVFIYLYVRTIFHVNSEEIMLDYRSVGDPNAHLRKLLIRLVFDLKNKTNNKNNDRYCCWPLSIVSCVCDTIISIHGVDSFLVNWLYYRDFERTCARARNLFTCIYFPIFINPLKYHSGIAIKFLLQQSMICEIKCDPSESAIWIWVVCQSAANFC